MRLSLISASNVSAAPMSVEVIDFAVE